MASIQARVLDTFLALKKRFSDNSGKLDVAFERADLESLAAMFKPLGRITCEPVDVNGIPAEWIIPPDEKTGNAILFIHGGSFNAGSIASHRTLAGNIAIASKTRALLIDYRLAPEHPFPAAIEDSVKAYEWILAQGIAAHQIIAAGDSAGGALVLNLLIKLRDDNKPLPAAGVCLSPVPDLTFSGASWKYNKKKELLLDERKERKSVEIYLKDVDPRSPSASPYFADLRGLPPLLIQIGSYEILLSDSELFAEKAKSAGVDVTLEVWPEMQHVWQFAAKILPEGRQAILRIGEFMEKIFSRHGK